MSTSYRVRLSDPVDRSYQVDVGFGNLHEIAKTVAAWDDIHRYVIITDEQTKELFGDALAAALKKTKQKVDLLHFPSGEKAKIQETVTDLQHQMLENHCASDTLILSLGGGVVGDIAGFVAATYMRGIPYVQIPTTLLAMTDSAIGGRVGVNTPYGKNLVGAFWHPRRVIIDMQTLTSLPEGQFINGLFEVIKMFVTHDARSFGYLEKHIDRLLARDESVLERVVRSAIRIRTSMATNDPHNEGEQKLIRFGHVVGQAIEKVSDYKMPHGYAVGYGMLVETLVAFEMEKITEDAKNRILAVLHALEIYGKDMEVWETKELLDAMKKDKDAKGGKTQISIMKEIGEPYVVRKAYIHPVEKTVLKKVLTKAKQGFDE